MNTTTPESNPSVIEEKLNCMAVEFGTHIGDVIRVIVGMEIDCHIEKIRRLNSLLNNPNTPDS